MGMINFALKLSWAWKKFYNLGPGIKNNHAMASLEMFLIIFVDMVLLILNLKNASLGPWRMPVWDPSQFTMVAKIQDDRHNRGILLVLFYEKEFQWKDDILCTQILLH